MQDATNITQYTFYVDDKPTVATGCWITEFGDIYVSLKHPNGGNMNVHTKYIHRYMKEREENTEL